MAGPKTARNPGSGGVRVREAEYTGAPFHVSDEAGVGIVPTHKSVRNFQQSPQLNATLADRPSTSGGMSTRKPSEKRGTRDDLHVKPIRANQFSTTYYNFPLPCSLPTPATTPRSSPSRSYSPVISGSEVARPNYAFSEMEIGMAIGSPTHQPTVLGSHVEIQATARENTPESLEDWKIFAHATKSKPSKWKILGGLFGRKSSDSSTEFYQIQTEVQTPRLEYVTSPLVTTERTRGRARTNSERKTGKRKPEIQRANTMPTDFQFQRSEVPPKVPPKGPKQFPILPETQNPEIRLEGEPLLNVEIPSVEMERYSVMFGSVIKPTASASSLLARRQATLDRLKVVNEAIAEHERREAAVKSKLLRPRRATSPQSTKSPAISLFPTTSRTPQDGLSHIPRKASPLHRSNTSPAALSPNRQTFEPLSPDYEEHTIMLAPTPTFQPTTTLVSPWSADETFVALDSPTSTISVDEVHDNIPLKPRLMEPTWEMVSPHPMPNSPMKVQPLKLAAKLDTQLHKLPRKPSLQSSLDALAHAREKEEAEELIRTSVGVSIARQVSMSGRQKQFLVPVKSKIANSSPVAVIVEGPNTMEGLLVNEKKSMTPRLVNIEARRAVKSERAVFDRT